MKNSVLLFASFVISLSFLASVNYAYFTDEGNAEKVITTDGFDIDVEKWQIVNKICVPKHDEAVKIIPATTVSKFFTLKNELDPSLVCGKRDIFLNARVKK